MAREWGGGPTVALHQKSFDLHETLAKHLGVTSYRKLKTLSVSGHSKGETHATWLDGKATSSLMDGATAQVTPLELTEKLMAAAVDRGATVVMGTVVGVEKLDGKVSGIRLQDQEDIAVDTVIFTVGPSHAPASLQLV